MLLRKKINAFTLSELIVVMILSSIVITMAVLIFTIVQKELLAIQQNYEHSNELKTLEQALWIDMQRGAAFYNAKNKHLSFISPVDTVSYIMNSEAIIRNQDTLFVALQEFKLLLNLKETQTTPDALFLKVGSKDLFIYKEQDAFFYMQK